VDSDDERWPSRIVEGNGVRLVVRDSQGASAPVVFLHGLGGFAGEWWPTASLLVRRHRVLAFDQRGHGGSTRRPSDLSRQSHVDDVIAVLDSLEVTEPVVLVGQSMGAHTALLVASQHPERVSRLALVEGGVGGGADSATDLVISWFRSWPTPFPDAATAADYFGGGLRGRIWASGLSPVETGLVPRFDINVLAEAIAPVHEAAAWLAWAAVRCPVLIVTGTNGYLTSQETTQMLATQGSASHEVVRGAGHDVHLDAPERLADLLEAFIR